MSTMSSLGSILIISPESWTEHTVSKQHYAMTLAGRGYRVFFLDPPDDSFSVASLIPVAGHPNLTVVRGPRVTAGLRFFPALLRRWLEARWLERFERMAACPVDVVWLFENSRFFDLRFAGSRLKIYHQVDYNQDFHAATAAATADISFCTTDFILTRLQCPGRHVYKIHHGLAEPVHLEGLSASQQANLARPGLHAVCVGNLDLRYLDVDLLTDAARNFPAVWFHFVGGYSPGCPLWQQAHGLSNVLWWGKVDSRLIPAILERADVLLLAYQAQRYREQLASPHKLMEYLASGKVILATYTDEYKDKRDLLEMVDEQGDYLMRFAQIVSNSEHYNSSARMTTRMAYACAHTYEAQVDRIFGLLRQHGLTGPNNDSATESPA